MVFREKIVTRIDDFDKKGYFLLPSLLKVLENVADHHSAAVTDESVDGSMHGIAWILAEWRVEIVKMPKYSDALFAETWISEGALAAHSNREFLISDESGNIFVKAAAKLTLFDLKANRIIKTNRAVLDKYLPEGTTVFSEKARRLIPAENYSSEREFSLRRSDIDYNGHVHNTEYLSFALEIMPEEAAESNSVASFRVAYKRPLHYGDKVVIRSNCDGGVWNICIANDDAVCAVVEIKNRNDL